ncbi:MAG: alpha/beta hydrolase, partial [Rhodothermales bacterium]
KAVSADYRPGHDYRHELLPDDAVMGVPLGSFLWTPAAFWPIAPMPEVYRRPDTTQVPTLILSGNLDFSTPADNVTTGLLPYMPNGTQVVFRDMGHILDLWRVEPAATERLLTSFLETGIADTSGIVRVPMDFHVEWGFPLLAKLVVGGVVLGVLLLIVIVWFVVRGIRRRRLRGN